MASKVKRLATVFATVSVCGALVLSAQPALAGAGGVNLPDRDSDGMPNRWEREFGLNPRVFNAKADPDGDGLRNLTEYKRRTKPRRADSDGDGLRDGLEVGRFGSNPKTRDTDADGIHDGYEDGDGNGILDEGEDRDREGFVGAVVYYDERDREMVIELATGWPILAYVPPGAKLMIEQSCNVAPYDALSVDDGVDVLELYLEPYLKRGAVVIRQMVLGCPQSWMS